MVNSSPEYAITKAGVDMSRKRDRPLRTYGKRSASTPEVRGEPSSKRLRTDNKEPREKESNLEGITQAEVAPAADATKGVDGQDDAAPIVKSVEERPKRPSILSYFKPVPPAIVPQTSEETIEPSSPQQKSPSSRPAVPQMKRKPRLLRLRATTSPIDDRPTAEADDETELETKETKARNTITRNEQPREPLLDQGTALHNQQRDGGQAHDRKTRASTKRKAKAAPTVQTTLNISAQAAFSECKVCDTVWNPLYPDDVKCHVKRHTAVLRAKRRTMDEL